MQHTVHHLTNQKQIYKENDSDQNICICDIANGSVTGRQIIKRQRKISPPRKKLGKKSVSKQLFSAERFVWVSVASNGHTIHCSSHCTSSTFSRKGAKYKSISWAEMYEFPPQFPFIIRARVCRGCLSSVLFWGRRILFVPGEGYVGYIEQGSGWT